MSIVILGWGSLIWDPRSLSHQIIDGIAGDAAWPPIGPTLPIEFCRVSSRGTDPYLSLVIDLDYGVPVRTRVATSTRIRITETVADLRYREGTVTGDIGYLDLQTGRSRGRHPIVINAMQAWAVASHVQGVVWTDLAGNFRDVAGRPFSAENALAFLQGLKDKAADRARQYVRRAPPEVDTPVRRLAVESGWLVDHPTGA